MKKVLLCEPIDPKGVAILENAGFEVVVSPSVDTETLAELVKGAYGMIVRTSRLDNRVLDAAHDLKIIARHGIGVDNIDIDYASKKGFLVARVLNANAYSVAEYSVTSMMTLGRKLASADQLIRTGKLSDKAASLVGLVKKYNTGGAEIKGKTLGIIGIGSIGSIIANLAVALGVSVIAYDPFVSSAPAGITLVKTLDDLLAQSDFITINVPLTNSTANMIDKQFFSKMKKTAYLINASRGGIVNEQDLTDALNNDVIAGAAVDVFSTEPPQLDNPLFQAKNAILTPHIAGTTQEAIQNLSIGSAQAIVDFAAGKNPTYIVNPQILQK